MTHGPEGLSVVVRGGGKHLALFQAQTCGRLDPLHLFKQNNFGRRSDAEARDPPPSTEIVERVAVMENKATDLLVLSVFDKRSYLF